MTGFSALPVADASPDDPRRWAGVARVAGPAWTRLPSLTVGLFGVQMLWSVEMSYAPPYLLALGLPKSLMAVVFLAGPLSGLLVQPAIGILADNSKSRLGRRRPFILVCTVLCAIATLLLGFTRPFASIFTASDSLSNDVFTIWLAILAIYAIDFSINAGEYPIQALDRALLVDTLPTAKQPAGNAWAACMLAIGSVAGFFVGNLDLPRLFPFLGRAQLEVLSVIAALLLLITHAWVCWQVKERILLSSSSGPKGLRQELRELRDTLVTLPSVIRQICWIQFFAWLGWFPVLFYSTVYIGDLHKRSSPVPETQEAVLALDAEATRLGTRALFYSALVSLVANFVMPLLVASAHLPLEPRRTTWLERARMHLASLWAWSHFIFACCMAATFVTETVSGATWIVSITGFCWAMTQWAPFALLGEAILTHSPTFAAGDVGRTVAIRMDSTRETRAWARGDGEEMRGLVRADEEDGGDGEDRVGLQARAASRTSSDNDPDDTSNLEGESTMEMYADSGKPGGLSAQAGAIIGIHNMFVVVPQFLVTGLSSIVFALLDPAKSVLQGHHTGGTDTLGVDTLGGVDTPSRRAIEESDGPDSIAIIFRFGGLAALVAFVLTLRLAKDLARG